MKLKTPKEITSDLAEETGIHIGDGSMNFYKNKRKIKGVYQLRGHINDDRNHYKTRVKELYKKLYDFEPSMRIMKSTGVYGFQVWSDDLINFKNKTIKLPLGKKGEIKIPKQFYKKEEFLIAVLRGIFDTDGCLYLQQRRKKSEVLYPKMMFTTTSKMLAKQIEKIFGYFKIKVTKYNYKRKEKNWRDLNTVCIYGNKQVQKAFNLIQPTNQKHIKKFKLYKEKSL